MFLHKRVLRVSIKKVTQNRAFAAAMQGAPKLQPKIEVLSSKVEDSGTFKVSVIRRMTKYFYYNRHKIFRSPGGRLQSRNQAVLRSLAESTPTICSPSTGAKQEGGRSRKLCHMGQ